MTEIIKQEGKKRMGNKTHNAVDGFPELPELMTKQELIKFLRIPEISKAAHFNNVIDNLQRMHGLPAIHIARQPLYPLTAVRRWLAEKAAKESTK